jgi:DNA repair protein RecO (recombination protein O)
LLWLGTADIQKASRIRFTPASLEEAVRFLEAFISHHLGHQARSLAFLTHIRSRREEGRTHHVG